MDWNEQQPNTQNQPNNNGQPYGPWDFISPPPPVKPANGFAIASLILGIMAILTLCTVYLPFLCGSLSIIFALLSKGSDKTMHSMANSGIITSVIALAITAIMFIFAFSMLASNHEFQQEFKQTYEEQYEDTYREIYGDSYGDMMDDILKELE